jgi:hypothetical protein
MSHNYTTVALPRLRRSVKAEARVRSRSNPFGIRDAKSLELCMVFPWYFHSPVSTLSLTLRTHTLTTVHTTQSQNSSPSLTKISVCVSLKNINKEPSHQVGVLYTESSGLVAGLNSYRSLRGQRRNWYIIIPF